MKIISQILSIVLVFSAVQECAGNTRTELLRLNSDSIQAYPTLGRVCVSHKGEDFTVYHQGKSAKVKKHDVDHVLRNMPQDTLKHFLENGKIKVNRFDNGDYSIRAHVTGKGGGPITANIFYWGTKGVCYSTAVAGVTATAATVGGPVAAAASVYATAGASTGVAAVGAAIAATEVGAVVATELTIAAASTGSVATVISAIEGAAAFMGALGMALPLP